MSPSPNDFPVLDDSYLDAYGQIDLKVYEAAREIWPKARRFGDFALQDHDAALDCLLKVAAEVSLQVSSRKSEIKNLGAYLLSSYKHLVGSEKAKRLTRAQSLPDFDESLTVEIVADLERKIMLKEIFLQLTEAERDLAKRIMFGYTYREIEAETGITAATARQRFSRLKRKIEELLARQKPSPSSDLP